MIGSREGKQGDRPDLVTVASSKIPPFYISQTLLGFGPGQPDLNRISLQLPNHESFVLCEMNVYRSAEDITRWHKLAAELSRVWLEKPMVTEPESQTSRDTNGR
jgi:hypothetical protein